MTAARHIWVNMFCFCWTHVSVGIFMSRSQPSITHSAASTQHILLEIMLFLGHLFSAGSCRCCWQLLSWKEVPATPKSKCFCFHFPVLVGFFFLFRCESKGGFPLGMIGITFAWLSLECGKPCLCLDFCFFKWEFHCVHDILTTLSLNQNPKKTYSDTNIHMHTKWVTHKFVWFKAESNETSWERRSWCHLVCRLEDFPIDAFVWDFLPCYQPKDKKSGVAQQIFPFSTLYSGLTDFMRSQRDKSTFKISQSKDRCRETIKPMFILCAFWFSFLGSLMCFCIQMTLCIFWGAFLLAPFSLCLGSFAETITALANGWICFLFSPPQDIRSLQSQDRIYNEIWCTLSTIVATNAAHVLCVNWM